MIAVMFHLSPPPVTPSKHFNLKNKYPANIIHVPRQLTRPKLTANVYPRKHGFVSKMQTLIPVNINKFTIALIAVRYLKGHSLERTPPRKDTNS